MKNLVLLCCLQLSAAVCFGQPSSQLADPREILQKSAELLKEMNLFRYESAYRIKYFDNQDTTPVSIQQCIVLKAPKDTILNYCARVADQDAERVYDGVNFLMIWHKNKKILRDNPHVTGKKFASNNIQKSHIPGFLYSNQPFNAYLTEAERLSLTEARLYGQKCWKIEVLFPANEEITFVKRVVFIDQESGFPMRIEGYAKFQDIQDEYWELDLKNIRAERKENAVFTDFYTYPEGYAEEVYTAPNFSFELLREGSAWIPFEGKDLAGNPVVPDSAGSSGLVLIDFWYLACAPCMRAMPEVAALSKKYKDQGLLVLGLNPFDDPAVRSEEIKKFSARFGVEYPLVFIGKKVAESYLAKTYPTFYLFDKGKMVFAGAGYSPEKMAELDKKIKGRLKK